MGEEARSRGTVVRFDDNKGFGFIKPDDGGEDLFVHHSAIKSDGYRSLQQGQSVEFSISLEGDRTKAIDVTAIGGVPIDRPRRESRGGYGFGSRGGSGGCYNCGEEGHLARDCRLGSRFSGGGGGGGAGGGVCFNCGLPGHLARDCNEGGGRGGGGYGGGGGGACYNCGGQGHMARDCPSGGGGGGSYGGRFGGGGGGGGGGGNCYNCGEAGHFARECTNRA